MMVKFGGNWQRLKKGGREQEKAALKVTEGSL